MIMAHASERETAEIVVQGMGVSPGVAVGPVFMMKADEEPVIARALELADIETNLGRFDDALAATRSQIQTIKQDVQQFIGFQDAGILDVHLMVLDDKVFIEEIREEIRERRHNVEYAVWLISDRYAQVLARIEDDYLRERMADVRDVARRLLRHLGARKAVPLDALPPGSIIVADNLAPSDTALLRREFVAGMATDFGSAVSHTAIMARALEIPAVVALHAITERVQPGETLLIDGNSGIVVIRPTPARLKTYSILMNRRHRLRTEIVTRVRDLPAITLDGTPIRLCANIDGLSEIDDVLKYGGDGIGLFRSESIFIQDDRYAGETEQLDIYRALADRMQPRPVIIRTLDLGGDKLLGGTDRFREDNPFLGCRGIRLCLAETGVFKTQLRAIAKAAAAAPGSIRIMYPMVSDVAELHRANALLREACAEVGTVWEEDAPSPFSIGVMIETPAAALCADILAGHADFMSIGSNDLIQYSMAADRGNDRVSYLYQPTHPAILRLIKMTVAAGATGAIPVSVCGEMAGDPILTPLLIGLGITDLSMAPAVIPVIRAVVRAVSLPEARQLAETACASRSGKEVLQQCREWLHRHVPDVFEWIG